MLVRSGHLAQGRLGCQLRHAFSNRAGGVSNGPFSSLNMGFSVGDNPEHVHENRRRWRIETDLGSIAQVTQVHGARVIEARADLVASGELTDEPADAIWTRDLGLAVGVRTADCVPVLLAALDRSDRVAAVAAIHAGWRGAVQGVVQALVGALVDAGLEPERMHAALGPAIGPESFEVGPEVVSAARTSLGGSPPKTREGPAGRPLLDLPDLVIRHLSSSGVPARHIDNLGLCTYAQPEHFFSHRRDAGRTGRHLSAIQIAP